MKKSIYLILPLIFIGVSLFAQDSKTETKAERTSNEYFKPLKYRSIGPFRGGRSVTATGVIGDPLTYYMGTTGGGLWKTTDAGQHWNNISDGFFEMGSVGAVAVSESDVNVVYCGMGEHAPRAVMTSHGDGVYKSTDSGKTWKNIGLKETQHIARIVIHPKNPDIVYVAAQGALYDKNKERGIFKSLDGGKTWKNVLFVDEKTGCSELVIDHNNPNVLYATMWEHQRLPWKVLSGGPGSGVYKSVDGGESWFKIEKGLPEEMGKMAISVCRANSDKVYALIESDSDLEKGGLFVSDNAGESWSLVSNDHQLVQRAWYYIEVFADPKNENTVYVMSAPALRSIDGGKTWERLTGTHGDFHDLWINPNNTSNLCIANDGGAAISFNSGDTWSTQDNMPTAQFYRINVDNGFPYRIYGGQQDNSSVSIAHREYGSRSIGQRSWTYSAGGESAFLAFDPDDPRYVLGGSYLGTIEVLDNRAQASTNIMAAPIQYLGRDAKDMKYRYNWNAPIIWSQHEPNTYYHGAQYLLKTSDMGQTWAEVSPDLTRNEKEKQGKGGGPYTNEAVGAENYGTLSYVIESPHEPVIWTGSDDGLVHMTKDGGKTWQNVTPKGLKECLINAIDISPIDPATAYIATTRYKFNDHTPGIYRTRDYGKTWENISGDIPQGSYTRVVREDEQRKDLLYAGTEKGIFVSWDGGKHWESLQLNLPITPILDLKMKHGDMIIATSGRSFWVLDDVNVIREYNKMDVGPKLYEPETTIIANGGSELNGNSDSFDGTDALEGVNPASGVVVYFELPEIADSIEVKMEIKDANGNLIRTLSSKADEDFKSYAGGPSGEPVLSKKDGLNRFVWDMRHSTMPGVPNVYIESSYSGHKVPPGKYNISVIAGETKVNTTCEILPNPYYNVTPDQYKEYDEFMSLAEDKLTEMHNLVNKLDKVKSGIERILKELPKDGNYDAIQKEGKKIIGNLKAWDEEMVQRKSKAYDDVENFPNKFTANYMFAINMTESDIPHVNQPSKDRIKELEVEWQNLRSKAMEILEVEVSSLNKKLWEAGVGAIFLENRA